MKPAKASRIAVACAVLYNMAKQWNEPEDNEQVDEGDQPLADMFEGPQDGRGIRAYVTNQFFN